VSGTNKLIQSNLQCLAELYESGELWIKFSTFQFDKRDIVHAREIAKPSET